MKEVRLSLEHIISKGLSRSSRNDVSFHENAVQGSLLAGHRTYIVVPPGTYLPLMRAPPGGDSLGVDETIGGYTRKTSFIQPVR